MIQTLQDNGLTKIAMSLQATSVNPVHHRDAPTGTPHRSHFLLRPNLLKSVSFFTESETPMGLPCWATGPLGQTITALAGMQTSKGATNDKGSLPEGGVVLSGTPMALLHPRYQRAALHLQQQRHGLWELGWGRTTSRLGHNPCLTTTKPVRQFWLEYRCVSKCHKCRLKSQTCLFYKQHFIIEPAYLR